MCYMTKHAVERVTGRLASLTSYGEVVQTVDKFACKMRPGMNYVLVRALPHRVEIYDPDVVPDGIAKGDWVVAVVDATSEHRVVTVMLRKSTSQSDHVKNILR